MRSGAGPEVADRAGMYQTVFVHFHMTRVALAVLELLGANHALIRSRVAVFNHVTSQPVIFLEGHLTNLTGV